jgi:hypothetical protein
MQPNADGMESLQIGTPERMCEINRGENDPPIRPPTGVFLVSGLNSLAKIFAM